MQQKSMNAGWRKLAASVVEIITVGLFYLRPDSDIFMIYMCSCLAANVGLKHRQILTRRLYEANVNNTARSLHRIRDLVLTY